MRKRAWIPAALVPAFGIGWIALRVPVAPVAVQLPPPPPPSAAPAPAASSVPVDDDHEDDRAYIFRMPSGEPTALTCDEAKTIVEQVRNGLASSPGSVDPKALASSAADWLDPHGLLSLAKDAPTTRALERAAVDLVADLEGKRQRSCASANVPGAALEQWSNELRDAFDRGRKGYLGIESSAALEPLPPSGAAREVAFEIGRRVGAFESVHGEKGKPYADEARRRFFPALDKAGWSRVVLASAVRAYVPLVDPHGEWAPFDEESRIYEVDLAARPPSRLWGRAVPTSVGVRISDAPSPPLAAGDVVLAVGSIATAGLPMEQVEQLGFAASDARTPLSAVVLRNGVITTLPLGARNKEDGGAPAHVVSELPHERVAFGEGDVLLVPVKDVRDDLGDELASLVGQERDRGPRKLNGIVIDLRGNGGGSTDGALSALSLFLPGAPLFAMRRRDGTIEVDRASIPRERDRWDGPVATLVDGSTASAAEMVAGALAAYRRGPTVGTPTFGKGCAQEYVDDDAHAGVLRLTTLVYALPDGSAVQRVGLVPQIRFPFLPEPGDGDEREAKLTHSAPAWRGPDLREPATAKLSEETQWPSHGGNVGPCKDTEACKALRLLGGTKRTPVAKH